MKSLFLGWDSVECVEWLSRTVQLNWWLPEEWCIVLISLSLSWLSSCLYTSDSASIGHIPRISSNNSLWPVQQIPPQICLKQMTDVHPWLWSYWDMWWSWSADISCSSLLWEINSSDMVCSKVPECHFLVNSSVCCSQLSLRPLELCIQISVMVCDLPCQSWWAVWPSLKCVLSLICLMPMPFLDFGDKGTATPFSIISTSLQSEWSSFSSLWACTLTASEQI